MKSAEIRAQFIDYFCKLGHCSVPSAPLVPADDPTLLFTNAGMNQFKDIFLGTGSRDYTRAVNSQKCMRVSGKHNDIEDVGRDTYHHTFFEMLGNWSFGDYYKREAIAWAWELLTREWRIPAEKLWATVFRDDDETARLWPEVTSIGRDRILRFDENENFWEMAETGPCGPCSEIHIDVGERHCRRQKEKGHRCAVNGGCGRFIELWNLVFIQYNRDGKGVLHDLPQKHVDTGMGFERLVAMLQGVDSNYATDLFVPIIGAIEEVSGVRYQPDGERAAAFRAIADHIRALSFALSDGALPSNEGRGYILRMILRRAVRYGRTLGLEEPFLYTLVPSVSGIMGDAYPELRQHREHVSRVILSEEERFHNTLAFGLGLLSEIIKKTKTQGRGTIPGEDLFRLYDTYGFPVDLAGVVAREEGLSIDSESFEKLMVEQKERARAAWKAEPVRGVAPVYRKILEREGTSVFRGYENTRAQAVVKALLRDGQEVEHLSEGQEGEIILDTTPFYAEAGGQVGDEGRIYSDRASALVADTQSPAQRLTVHAAKVINGELRIGDPVTAEVDEQKRMETARSHTATHLLQNALRQVLGEHIKQAGSLVAPGRLRFDFTHFTALSSMEMERVEEVVNERIRDNAPLQIYELPFEEVRAKDIIAIFGEKYGDRVRVVDAGGYSRELCGGTHVRSVGEIGLFVLLSEGSVAAGVRRIEALTGAAALRYLKKREAQIKEVASLFRTDPDSVVERIESMRKENKALKKSSGREDIKQRIGDAADLITKARNVGDIPVIAVELPGLNIDALRNAGDHVKQKLKTGVILLGSRDDDTAHLVCMVTDDLVRKGLHAGKIVKEVASIIGGNGGGRPQMAQAGGSAPDRLPEALEKVSELVARISGGEGERTISRGRE